jgi:hypothetical protein
VRLQRISVIHGLLNVQPEVRPVEKEVVLTEVTIRVFEDAKPIHFPLPSSEPASTDSFRASAVRRVGAACRNWSYGAHLN